MVVQHNPSLSLTHTYTHTRAHTHKQARTHTHKAHLSDLMEFFVNRTTIQPACLAVNSQSER